MTKSPFPKGLKAYADVRLESSHGERFYVDRNKLSRHLTIDREGRTFRTASAAGFLTNDAGAIPGIADNPFSRFARGCYEGAKPIAVVDDSREAPRVPADLKDFCLGLADDVGFRFTWEDRTIEFVNTLGHRTLRHERTRVVRMDYALSMGSRAISLRKFAYDPTTDALSSHMQEFSQMRRVLKGSQPVSPSQNAQVILHPSLAAVWIHEVVGHWAEMVSQGPALASHLGQRVASEVLTVRDLATDASAPFVFSCDDEGIHPEEVLLLENGVFREPYLSIERAFFSGVHRLNGRARAQDFKFSPIPRMMNVCLSPGAMSYRDMIAGVESGYLLIGSLGGLRGPSLFQVQSQYGFEIVKGRLGKPVYGPLLMGLHSQALENVVAVSQEFSWIEDGGCLSEGQFLDQSGRGAPYLWLRGVQLY